MPAYEMNLFFRQFERGWSESFFVVNGASVPALHALVGTAVVPLALQLRDKSTVLQAVRIVEAGGNRVGNTRKYGLSKSPNATTPGNPDEVATSLSVRIGSEAGKSRSLFIRGVDDDLTRRRGIDGTTIQGTLKNQMDNYLNAVALLGGAVQYLTPAVRGGGASLTNWQNVQSFGSDTTNAEVTQVNLQPGEVMPQEGMLVYFRGLENPRFLYLRGVFRVLKVTATPPSFTINARFRESDTPVDCRDTQWRQVLYLYSQMSDWGNYELGKRDTGRPIITHRGRRSPVTRRR